MPINLLTKDDREQEQRELFEKEKQEQKKIQVQMSQPVTETGGPSEKIQRPKRRSFLLKKKQKEKIEPEAEPEAEAELGPSISETLEKTEKKPKTKEKEPIVEIIEKQEKLKKDKKEKKPKEIETEPKGLDISLMSERAVVIPRVIRSRFLLFLAAIIVIFTIFTVVWLYADWYFEDLSIEVHKLRGEMQLLEAESVAFLDIRNEVMDLETKAARVESILNNHIYWTKFFTLLETYTIPDIYFADFAADTSGTIHLEATGRDLISVAEQIIAFSNAPDFIKAVRASNIRKLPKGIGASFDLSLVDGIFYK